MTFTAESATSINIQVENGTGLNNYDEFVLKNANREEICRLLFGDPLNDCSDTRASPGNNYYYISAQGKAVSSTDKSYTAKPMTQKRKFVDSNQQSFCWKQFYYLNLWFMLTFWIVATQTITLSGRNDTSITVNVSPGFGMQGYQMVVRSKKYGRVLGICDQQEKKCSASRLRKGYLYTVWLRTCTGSSPVTCKLEANPINVGIAPDRKCMVTSSFVLIFKLMEHFI